MKKKFISVAMFCALIASSPVWVGCSDYDDDIANLQSQVDALKQTVDVSTAEALKALQEAQAALQEDINELTAGKADAQAVKDLQETVAALQTAITENDITKIGELSSQVSELIAQVNGIEGDLDKTQSDLQQQKTELEGKVNSLRADLEKAIADKADQATVDSIKSELDTAVTNLTDVENRLVEVEKWIKNNGQELAKLTANVSQINNLIAKISEEAATTISDPAILAAIKALPTTVSSLTTLQQQIGKETEAGSILYRLAALEEWKNTIVTELLTGTGYSSFADICQDIKELQEALTGSGSETPGVDPSDPGLVEQFNALKAEMAKFDMIQSVVYIPNATEAETGYLLKSSVLKVYNEKSTNKDKYDEAAKAGAKYVFTSLQIPEEDYSNLNVLLPKFFKVCKQVGLQIVPDVSPATFEKLNVKKNDYDAFKRLGFHQLRLDYGFDDFELIRELQKDFFIFLNASVVTPKYLAEARDAKVDFDKIALIYNYYPHTNTGMSWNDFKDRNQ